MNNAQYEVTKLRLSEQEAKKSPGEAGAFLKLIASNRS
jgi:hypothetical protein